MAEQDRRSARARLASLRLADNRCAASTRTEDHSRMGHGLQGVLSDDEHPGEDLFAFSLSDKQDIHLSSNWVASNFELDPGATFAFQVDQLDEGGAGAPGGVQPDTTRHAIAINQTAAQQLRPRSLAITKVGRCQGACNRGPLSHHRAEALMRTRYSLLAGTRRCGQFPWRSWP